MLLFGFRLDPFQKILLDWQYFQCSGNAAYDTNSTGLSPLALCRWMGRATLSPREPGVQRDGSGKEWREKAKTRLVWFFPKVAGGQQLTQGSQIPLRCLFSWIPPSHDSSMLLLVKDSEQVELLYLAWPDMKAGLEFLTFQSILWI